LAYETVSSSLSLTDLDECVSV